MGQNCQMYIIGNLLPYEIKKDSFLTLVLRPGGVRSYQADTKVYFLVGTHTSNSRELLDVLHFDESDGTPGRGILVQRVQDDVHCI